MTEPHLTKDQCVLIESILRHHLPKNTEIWVFGSRTTSHHKPFSDLDLFIKSVSSINKNSLTQCEYTLEASSFPYKVDLLDWSSVNKKFRQVIENNPHFLWFII